MQRKGAEELVRWYLRLNGYFTIDSFIVHAADDPKKIRSNKIGSHTETDIIAVRMPYSKEITGKLTIQNHEPLVEASDGRFDFVIAEVKTGSENKPNDVWKKPDRIHAIEYIVRFIGQYEDESQIKKVASSLQRSYKFEENGRCRYRYIIVARRISEHYKNKGIKYITFDEIFDFLHGIRGDSWIKENLGVASMHDQWPELIKNIFKIINDRNLKDHEVWEKLEKLFSQSETS